MRLTLVIFAIALIGLGVYLYLQGNTITATRVHANDPTKGFYLVMIGAFLIIAAMLILALQIFPRKSVLYY
ncbi:MAG TPA: hypothetical protein ENO13_02065 [Candidatus Bathyarchaeota archaeon]|nr:hypothetical protein [Candidatus Bathyarchaeota archaeon]